MTAKRIFLAGGAVLLPALAQAGVSGFDQVIGDLPDGKAIIITHTVTIDAPTSATQISSQGQVSGSNFTALLTDDPDVAGQNATITSIQQVPGLTNRAQNINEDQLVTFALSSFEAGYSDGNGDVLATLRISSLPSTGTLFRSGGGGAITSVPTDIPRAQIAGMTYVPQENFPGPSASFGWNASDGASFATNAASYTFNITALNDGPLPLPDALDRFATSSLKFPLAVLLANDIDPDTGTNAGLRVVSVSGTSANGGAVTLSGGTVFYDPRGHTGPDSFTYIVEDGEGLAAAQPVRVDLTIFDETAQSLNIDVSVDPATGNATVAGVGIPNRVYRVQAADTGVPNWFDLPGGAVLAGPDGRFSYTDPGPLPPTRIYRTVHP